MAIGRAREAIAATVLCLLAGTATGLETGTAVVEPAVEAPVRNWAGIKRDTTYFLGYELTAVAVISVWPQDDSSKPIGWDRWVNNVTHPHWDADPLWVNYLMHPYWGAAYYTRAREQGYDRTESFLYSALLSTIFEYGAEAMIEPVSIQDLVVTPVVGSLLGEYLFGPLRRHIRAKEGPLQPLDHVALVLTEPLDAINSGVGRLLGVETQLTLRPTLQRARGLPGFPVEAQGASRDPRKPVWTLVLRAVW